MVLHFSLLSLSPYTTERVVVVAVMIVVWSIERRSVGVVGI